MLYNFVDSLSSHVFLLFSINNFARDYNIFKIGGIWCFKHFFNDREVFNELSGYYNHEKYRFELKNIEERKEVINYLEDKGFEITLIENSSDYTVKISKYNEYREILKNSIEAYESGRDKIFIMSPSNKSQFIYTPFSIGMLG